jgi:phospholipid/cholesterol/gamma-HCH transport system permease protein
MTAAPGKAFLSFFEGMGAHLIFLRDIVVWMFRPPFDAENFIKQMMEIGYRSVPVTGITLFFTGMVMALQIGRAMDAMMPGSSMYIGSAVTIAMFRELSPVLTGLLLAGRVGSAIAAQIGTMRVTEQIDALVTLQTNPIQYLAVPRFISCLIMVPALTVLSDALGVIGGGLVAFTALNVPPTTYIDNILNYTTVPDLMSGVAKSLFFGAEIAVIACYQGFTTKGGAEGVGRATIRAVVLSSMTILISDYFLTYLLQLINL